MTTPQCPSIRHSVRAGAACTQCKICTAAQHQAFLHTPPRAECSFGGSKSPTPCWSCVALGLAHRQDMVTLLHAQTGHGSGLRYTFGAPCEFDGHPLPASTQLLLLHVQAAHLRWPSLASRQPCSSSAGSSHHRTRIWLQTQQHGICRSSWICHPALSRGQAGLVARRGASLRLLLAAVLVGRHPSSSQQDSRRGVLLRQASHLCTLDQWGSQ